MRRGALIALLLCLIGLPFGRPAAAQETDAPTVADSLAAADETDSGDRPAEAGPHFDAALETARQTGEPATLLAEILIRRSRWHSRQGRLTEAVHDMKQAQEIQRSDPALALDSASTLLMLAGLAYRLQDQPEWERLVAEAAAIRIEHLGRSAELTVLARMWPAYYYARSDQRERAEQILASVERDCEQDLEPSPALATCYFVAANQASLWMTGERVESRFLKVLAIRESITTEGSVERVDALLQTADALQRAKYQQQAATLFRRALEAVERRPDRDREVKARRGLAAALWHTQQPAESLEQYEAVLVLHTLLSSPPEERIRTLQGAAAALFSLDDNQGAFERLEMAVEIARYERGASSVALSAALDHIARLYQQEGRYDEARRALRDRLRQLALLGAASSLRAGEIEEALGDMDYGQNKGDEAVEHFSRMVEIRGAHWGQDSEKLVDSLTKLAQAHRLAEQHEEADAVEQRIAALTVASFVGVLKERASKFQLFGWPGLWVLLGGFVGVGAVVVAGGAALTRYLAAEGPMVADASPPQLRVVVCEPRDPQQGSFEGEGGEIFGIWIVNVLLTVVTLGLYHFWAKVRMRRYVWAHAGLADDRFAFHGTPRELFLGWLKGAPLLIFILYGPTIAQLGGASEMLTQQIALVAFGLALLLWPIAEVGAHRYRLTRTSWRGIRFAFDGSPWRYLGVYLVNWPLWVFTLGLWTPFFNAYKRRFLIGHMSFGNSAFHCEARGKDLFWRYALNWLLFLPTLGLYGFWYRAFRERYYWSRTSFRGAGFRCTITGGQLFELYGVGALLILLTLGLAWPWVQARRVQTWLESIHIEGDPDLASVRQRGQDDAAVGEGFADFLGLDMGFLA